MGDRNHELALAATVDRRERGALDATLDSRAQAALDATLASTGPGARAAAATRNPTASDYRELVPVDPAHYQLSTELARGGMGRIQLARDRRLGRTVAVKELLARDGELALRFEREARITARLQHPSIVSIYEAGLWPSGFPFYAMPCVNGRSLDEVVADAKTLDARLGLVPTVLAVADAIAYAHGQRVIHRDLKPRNVLVGSFGETVVIDWGLAKDLTSAAHEPGAGPYRTRGTGLETEVGEIMGTPAYMPPEQAEGDAVDERADVYAIGAMLLHVLTGRPPYEGRTAVEILDAVRHTPPLSLRACEPSVPADLIAIVERAMARDAADRYPTARELADDLRRFQTGQLVGAHRYSLGQLVRRWIARHRAPIAVGVAALALLAVVGVISIRGIIRERERADAQRMVAEKNRARADELTDFMLFDMRAKLEPVGKLELLDVVARKAATYYDERSDFDPARRAAALENIGDVLVAKGDVRGAHTSYSHALGMRTTAAFNAPLDAATQLALVSTYLKLGHVASLQGNSTAAALLYEHALGIEPRTATLEWKRRRIELELRVARIQQDRGDAAGARARLESTLALARQAALAQPFDVDLVADEAKIQSALADVLDENDITKSIEHRRAGLALLDKLSARSPEDMSLLVERANQTRSLGAALEIAGDPEAQLASYRTALAIMERLVAHDPTNAQWQQDHATTHQEIGRALAVAGDLEGGLASLARAVELAQALVHRDPTNVTALRGLANAHHRVAAAYRESVFRAHASTKESDAADLVKARKAVDEYRISLELGERVVKLDPTNHDARRSAAMTREQLAHALALANDFDAAIAEFRESLAQTQQLAAIDPNNHWWQADVGHVHLELGSTLRKLGDVDGALAEYRKALAIQETLQHRDPANVEWAREVVTTHMFMGHAHYDRRRDRADADAAVAEYTASLDITRRLAAAAPDDKGTAAAVAFLEQRVAMAKELRATFN